MSNKKLSQVIKQKLVEVNCNSVSSVIGIIACELSQYDFEDVCNVLEDIKEGNIDTYIGNKGA